MRTAYRYLSVAALIVMGYFLGKGIQALYLRSLPIARLMKTLDHIALVRKKEGFQGKQAYVISLRKGSKVILLGDIAGNYESLMHIRDDLVRTGLLTQKGVLHKNVYLILMDPFLGPTKANGQVLKWLAQMMKDNPATVWFLRSQDDIPEKLQDLSLFEQSLSFYQKKTLNAWYASLPLAIYLLAENLSEPPLRITPSGTDSSIFERIACRRVEGEGPLKALCKLNALCAYVEGPISGTFDNDDKSINWATMKGLQGSQGAWHLISCPSRDTTQRFGYSISAYAVMTLGNELSSSSLTFYYAAEGSAFGQGDSFPIYKHDKR